ncbi:MAG: mannonate dehydratase [Rhodobacteraceae bacterium]|nr:mannonate dehydratase [Paracoccaceae bacterium]
MRETWRWFGPADEISLAEIRQTGAQGIVTALHHVAPGAVWTPEEIRSRQAMIEAGGLTWDVVESLPVSEDIKTQGPEMVAHLDAYRESLRNLAAAGIRTVCYNFMPVLDWTRTTLRWPLAHGGDAMRFDLVDFIVFDLCLLKRLGAEEDYVDGLRDEAETRYASMTDGARQALVNNIVAGLPGANERWTLEDVTCRLATYDGIDAARLRAHLLDFLSELVPLAEELGINLCCHPDDPPFSLLGLPRVMSNVEDYAAVVDAVDCTANGITFCTGSLGVDERFDGAAFVERLGGRIHFVHLRNTRRDGVSALGRHSFYESEHLDGDTDMVATIRALMDEEARRRNAGRKDAEIPMRPDHGHSLLADLDRPMMPGYPLIGRLKGLAELRGVMAACV